MGSDPTCRVHPYFSFGTSTVVSPTNGNGPVSIVKRTRVASFVSSSFTEAPPPPPHPYFMGPDASFFPEASSSS